MRRTTKQRRAEWRCTQALQVYICMARVMRLRQKHRIFTQAQPGQVGRQRATSALSAFTTAERDERDHALLRQSRVPLVIVVVPLALLLLLHEAPLGSPRAGRDDGRARSGPSERRRHVVIVHQRLTPAHERALRIGHSSRSHPSGQDGTELGVPREGIPPRTGNRPTHSPPLWSPCYGTTTCRTTTRTAGPSPPVAASG
jgi:hypothetical protein